MSDWLLVLVYAAGYLTGVAYAVTVARRTYADKESGLWDSRGKKVDGSMAVLCGLLVLALPLLWPIIGIGMLGWRLVLHGVDDRGADAPSP